MHSTALLRCLSECFRRYGRRLHMVSRSSEPLRIVVVDDLVIPGPDGFDLLDQIRGWGTELGGDVPVIITTGLRDPDLESKVRNVGVVYLSKPFTPIKLFNSITEALNSLPSLKRRWNAFPMVANSGS